MSDVGPPGALRDAWLAGSPPANPLPALRAWLAEARAERVQPNPDAAALATVDAAGRPSARMVLCRAADWEAGWLGFYTNRESEKARALAAHPHAALLFHWDGLGRQARVTGPVVAAPASDADRYFATRPRESQLAAWASAQSRPVASRAELLARFEATAARFGADAPVPRPPHWGGYRVWIESLELWASRPHRLHDRVRWTRSLAPRGEGFAPGPWRCERLQP